jgi:Leucine-rich repeat (LRR) protein
MSLTLDDNQVTDLSPLLEVANLKELTLSGNPLDQASRNTYIPALRAQGVKVTF